MTLFHTTNHHHFSSPYAVSVLKTPSKFKIIDFHLLLNLCINKIFCLCSSLFRTNCLCHAFFSSRAKPQNRVEREEKSNQSHSREQKQQRVDKNYSRRTKTIKKKSCVRQKSFSIESAFESFFILAFSSMAKARFQCVGEFLPIFHAVEKKIFFHPRHRCVRQNVYNHSKYITVEYNVTMPTAHIFAIFHHNFSSVYTETFFAAANDVFERLLRRWKMVSGKSFIQQFKN